VKDDDDLKILFEELRSMYHNVCEKEKERERESEREREGVGAAERTRVEWGDSC
jgi:hypothetical protein